MNVDKMANIICHLYIDIVSFKIASFFFFFLLDHVSANYSLQAKSGLWPVSVNNIFLNTATPISFLYCLWLLFATIAELNCCNTTIWTTKSKVFIIWPFKESLLTFVLEE